MAQARQARRDADFVLHHSSELVTCRGPAPRTGADLNEAGVLPGGALAAREGRIVWVGPEEALEREVRLLPGGRTLDAGGRAVLPGFVDPHTHLPWAGDRAGEFAERLAGATYQEIAARGGGILSTVAATRGASEDELVEASVERLGRMLECGTTTAEAKSGYGLSPEAEAKQLRAIRRAGERSPVELAPTLLAAHTLPPEARGSVAEREAYLRTVCERIIPETAAAGLAEFVDVFLDDHAYTLAEGRAVLAAAREAGLGVKVHADQLSAGGGAELAAEFGAVSADHLEQVSDEGLAALARAGTVAVLLPGATFFLRMKDYAPARRIIDSGVPVALATDLNPGSCFTESMPMILQIACLSAGLTVDEALVAGTLNAAAALGRAASVGSLEVGKSADLVVLAAADRAHLVYHFGVNLVETVVKRGEIVYRRPG
jgi:imidazolonepropionase